MNEHITGAWLRARAALTRTGDRLASDLGEGVISAAITVLIMAFLGAAMWVAFNTLFTETSTSVSNQVNQIGGNGSGTGTGG